ncbi:hypothetical protein VPJ68_06450, partial [Parabacteroides distasonis]
DHASLTENLPCYLAAGYLGDADAGYAVFAARQWEQLRIADGQLCIFYTMLENTQEMFCLIQGNIGEDALAEKIAHRLFRNLRQEDMPVWALTKLEDIRKLQSAGKE